LPSATDRAPASAAAANASGGISPSTSRAPASLSQRASRSRSVGQPERNCATASALAASSIVSASFWTSPTSTSIARTASGGATASEKSAAGADVHTVIGSPGARWRSRRSTSPVRVACPNPCPET
jgi:hypothetical protein